MKVSQLVPALVLLSPAIAFADVTLPAIISDHMVLEKTAKVPLWGKAEPGEEVSVTLDGQTVKTKADSTGKWTTSLNLENSKQGPFEMVVQGKNQIKVADVVVGEVWVASGQSNMEWSLARDSNAEKEIAASENPLLRQFLVTKATSDVPLDDCKGTWVAASPATSGSFTAVGYYFGKTLQADLKVPVGILHTSWGGTPSEAWTSTEALDTVPDLAEARNRLKKRITDYPEVKKAFVEAHAKWAEETGRKDKEPADVAAFAGSDASTDGWVKVTVPGALDAAGLPKSGAIWLRKEVEVPAALAGKSLPLVLGVIDGFDSVYWNGKLLTQTTPENYPGDGVARRGANYTVPEKQVKEGKNILAIRVYEPLGPVKIVNEPAAGAILLKGEWLAKAEYELPGLDAAKSAAQPTLKPAPGPQNIPTFLFNAMINPVVPYAISGVIWYQGESNAGRAWQYRTAFPLMITDWRSKWKQGDFPFYFCQLANYMKKPSEPGDSAWAELREAQTSTLQLPNTGQAILIDIGEGKDIHPRNKKDVGERLAKIALAKDYGKKIPYSGPVYESSKTEDGKIRLKFAHTDGGLVAKPLPATYDENTSRKETSPLVRNSPDSELEGFAICGADKQWVWADAKIDGDTVIVSSAKVTAPVAVRYAWADNPTVNLYNGAGLPAVPFRTDDFPATTKDVKLEINPPAPRP